MVITCTHMQCSLVPRPSSFAWPPNEAGRPGDEAIYSALLHCARRFQHYSNAIANFSLTASILQSYILPYCFHPHYELLLSYHIIPYSMYYKPTGDLLTSALKRVGL